MAQINESRIFNEINTPFRFYDSEKKRNENKPQCSNDCPYKLITPQHFMLPFMIVRDVQIEDIATFKIITENGATEYSLSTSLIERQTFTGKDYFIYKGQNHGLFLDCGFYYCEVADSYGRTYYSERFFVMTSGYCGNIAMNGDFKTDLSYWNIFGSVTWSSGKASLNGGGFGTNFNQYVGLSKKVRVTFTVSDWAGSGAATVQIGASTVQNLSGNGTVSVIGNTEGTGRVFFTGASTRTYKLDNVIIAPLSSDSLQCGLMIEWKSDCDFGNTYYGSGFANRFYCPPDAPLGEPTYRITREGTTNGDGDFIESFRKRQKVYNVELGLVPEYVLDALMDMQLHPIKNIYLPDCEGYAEITDVNVSASWEFNGCYANVQIQFSIGQIVETGCCGNLSQCLECCQTAWLGIPETPEDGKYYIDPPNGKLYLAVGIVLQEVSCDSGYVCHHEDDHEVDEAVCPTGWILSDGIYVEVPSVLSITPDASSSTAYIVKALLLSGYIGQLEVSSDGGSSWSNEGTPLNDVDWLNVGKLVSIPTGETRLYRIYSYAPNCDNMYSCPSEASATCLIACMDANEYKIAPYVIGETYMLLDGTLGVATTTNGDFTVIACTSQIVHEPTLNVDFVYSAGAVQWFPSPTIYSVVGSGATVNIKAAMPLGSTGELYVDGIASGLTASAADWDSIGLDYNVTYGTTYSFTVVVTDGDCDYGTSEAESFTAGTCTFYQATGIDTSAHNPASVWKGITVDASFYDFVSFCGGSYPALTDNAALKTAIECVLAFLTVDGTVAVGYVAPTMYPNINTFNPSSYEVDSITILHPDTTTADFTYTKSCV